MKVIEASTINRTETPVVPPNDCVSEVGTKVRYTGASLGFQVAAAIGGGLSPVLAKLIATATVAPMTSAFVVSKSQNSGKAKIAPTIAASPG